MIEVWIVGYYAVSLKIFSWKRLLILSLSSKNYELNHSFMSLWNIRDSNNFILSFVKSLQVHIFYFSFQIMIVIIMQGLSSLGKWGTISILNCPVCQLQMLSNIQHNAKHKSRAKRQMTRPARCQRKVNRVRWFYNWKWQQPRECILVGCGLIRS